MEINTASDLLEFNFTPEETNRAMQLQDRQLSLMYLQQMRIATFRQIVALRYTPEDVEKSVSEHRYLSGRLDCLDELIRGILEPTQLPVNDQQQQMQL